MSSAPDESRPVLVFDGDCGFCRRGVAWLQHRVGDAVRCTPWQSVELASLHPDLRAEDCARAVQLVEPDGRLTRGAEAGLRALSFAQGYRLVPLLYRLPGVGPLAEAVYRAVANRRGVFSRMLGLVSGPDPGPATYLVARRLFFVLLGVALAWTIGGFWLDAHPLMGEQGLVPTAYALRWDEQPQPAGVLAMPSVLWLARSDLALHLWLALGVLGAVLVIARRRVRTGLALAALVWIGFVSTLLPPSGGEVANPFVGFPADGLLIETAVLALLLAPGRVGWNAPVRGGGLFLLRLLCVRAVFFEVLGRVGAGGVWSSADAFAQHLWMMPVPTALGVLLADGPFVLREAMRVTMLAIGLGGVFLLLGPRRLRVIASAGVMLLATWIGLTEARGAWSLLVVALAILALDDACFARAWRREAAPTTSESRIPMPFFVLRTLAVVGLLVPTAVVVRDDLRGGVFSGAHARIAAWFVCNGYRSDGLASDLHPVAVLEGSADGEVWERIDPLVAPGDLTRRPPWFVLSLPRMDLRLELAARTIAGGGLPPDWLLSAVAALLERRGSTRALFAPGAFMESPPRLVRLRVRPYRPADASDRAAGMWWYHAPDLVPPRPFTLQNGQLVELGG